MKKKRKKSIRRKSKNKKKSYKSKSNKKLKKKSYKKRTNSKKKIKNFKRKILRKNNKPEVLKKNKSGIILNIIRLQNKFKDNFSFKFSFNFLKIDQAIQSFFQRVDDKIIEYKTLKADENRRIKIEKIEKEREEKERIEVEKKEIEKKILKEKEKQLKDGGELGGERAKDIKLFLRKEQAEKQKRFLQEIKLEKQIERFRIREIKELEKLEKTSLKEQREDYSGLQERIEKLKEKYRLIRDQKIRERVEALGVKTSETDDRETLLRKEREYSLERQKIELSLESFYRSASSLVFQLNKRHITRHMSIFRCIDRRFETGEIFIKWDESSDEDWLILIYIKDNAPDKGIVIEDKTNPDKNLSNEYKSSEIFKASDAMVDSLTQLLSRERSKKNS